MFKRFRYKWIGWIEKDIKWTTQQVEIIILMRVKEQLQLQLMFLY